MSADIVQIRDYQPKAVTNYGVCHKEPAIVFILPASYEALALEIVRRLHRKAPRSLLSLKKKMEALRKLQAAERGE